VQVTDHAGNPAVAKFTVNIAPFVGAGAPPGGAGAGGGAAGGGGAGGGAAGAAGGAGGGAAGAAGLAARPRVLGLAIVGGRPQLRVSKKGIAQVTVRTLGGKRLGRFSVPVVAGRNRIVAPRRLAGPLPEAGTLRMEVRITRGGVAGPLFSSRVQAVALNPQPLPPKARARP
jgi:hypothetical protein